jgi:hypothetical protein
VHEIRHDAGRGQIVAVALITGSAALLAVAVVGGAATTALAAAVLLATMLALTRPGFIGWPRILSALVLIILFIPIRRYALPGNLPFDLEPYRVFIAVLIVGWTASLLVDRRTRLRRTGFEGPLVVILGAAFASVLANPARLTENSVTVNKSLTFLLSFVLLLYVLASVLRGRAQVDLLVKTLVGGGAVVAMFAIIEARTGFNVFNHLSRVVPPLRLTELEVPGGFLRVGAAKLRVFGSAEHPIALSAALVMLIPLSLYLALSTRQRRWLFCGVVLAVASWAAVSRTGIVMFVVVGLVFLALRPRETRKHWKLVIPALVVIKVALPGTLGAIRQSFFPPGGLIAEQQSNAGGAGSGRLADLGPALDAWVREPLFGQGYAMMPIIHPGAALETNILDNQWLGTLISTGIVGFVGWLWFFLRAMRMFGSEARRDQSDRGWLLVAVTAGIAAFGVGMLTYDAFAFIQVTFLLFILVGLGRALLAEEPASARVRADRPRDSTLHALPLASPPSR